MYVEELINEIVNIEVLNPIHFFKRKREDLSLDEK
jgi:hypothetical protein